MEKEETIFSKIIQRKIPAKIVFENDEILAFYDIAPQAPVHVLIIPKKPIARIEAAETTDAELLGKMLLTAQMLARDFGLAKTGFRLVFNNGPDAGEAVPHLHLHLLGGRKLNWPPG
ncbi:MAG: histidine triad nucleotide-binding protein [Verrucomicrobiia bacterium]